MIFNLTVLGILKVVAAIDGKSAEYPLTSPPSVAQFTTADSHVLFANSDAFIPSDRYPTPRREESVQDTYANSVVIKDPYRWMENPDSPETRKFIEDEMAITKPYLERSPYRAELTARYKELFNYPKYDGPTQAGKKFFSYQNTGLQNQDVLYIHDEFNDEGKIFLNPNEFSKDGTVALNSVYSAFSDDGNVFAYLIGEGGSEWNTLQFKHVEKGNIYKEKLTKIKFPIVTWSKDNKGVFYTCFPDHKEEASGSDNTMNKNQKIFYHLLGTAQSEDVLVTEFPDHPDYLFRSSISDDGKYFIVTPFQGNNNNLVYVADLDKIKYEIKGKLELIPIVTKIEATYMFITNTGSQFIFHTNKDADNFKLIVIDITKPDPNSWRDLVPEDKNNTLEWAKAAWDKYLVLCYIQDVKSVLQLHEAATGKMVKKFNLEIGSVPIFFSDKKYKDIFFKFESYLSPGIIYHCDLSNTSFNLEIFKEIEVPNFNRTKFTVEQVFFNSKDGTRIPMNLVYKNGLQKNRNNFVFMTAYGGYGISILPDFSVNRLVIVDNFDGIYAIPNIRGGGEYGERWHKDGSLDKKQNSFDDFQAAAEFLIKENYTSSKLLAIYGKSNGGVLMAACLNQRPDLFGAVIADVGALDMLRFDQFTIGHFWISEYGSPSNVKDFQYLIKYSPLHNIKIPEDPTKQYPATMVTTSDHDDRVPPLHSLKFIATLQFEAKKHPNQKNPLIIRVETDTGHGGGKPTVKIIDELVNQMSFIIINTGIKFHSS